MRVNVTMKITRKEGRKIHASVETEEERSVLRRKPHSPGIYCMEVF